jgi:hypothetical protein
MGWTARVWFPATARDILPQSIISWTVVLPHHITRYSHTLTHIHILPQNSRRWPLCKSANIGIAAGNTAEKYLQEGPVRFPLWQWRFPISSADWNRRPRSFSFKRGKKKKSHVARSGEYGGCDLIFGRNWRFPVAQTATFSISPLAENYPSQQWHSFW